MREAEGGLERFEGKRGRLKRDKRRMNTGREMKSLDKKKPEHKCWAGK